MAPPQGELGFGGVPELELSLRAPEVPEVQVEPCQTRGGAKIAAGSIVATVGEAFELFFRLSGLADARVLVEIHHQGAEAEVAPCVVDGRFAVTAPRGTQEVKSRSPAAESNRSWLFTLPEGGVRQLFEHLATHGVVTEGEATAMLGGPRELRRFANRFRGIRGEGPFDVRIDVIGWGEAVRAGRDSAMEHSDNGRRRAHLRRCSPKGPAVPGTRHGRFRRRDRDPARRGTQAARASGKWRGDDQVSPWRVWLWKDIHGDGSRFSTRTSARVRHELRSRLRQ